MSNRKNKLAIIDAHALIHRAYHALPPMTTADGRPTGATYGFTTMLLKMLTTVKPTHVVAAFDMKGPTFRHQEFKEYKANRKKPDDELVAQFDTVREVLKAFNIPIIQEQGFEADDLIGTLTQKLDGGIRKVVVTGDKDTFQLIDDDTDIFTLKRGISDTILFNEELVKEQYGFGPELIPDYKGLAGDASDNIPGVAGIGDKTAKELVSKYGPVEEIYEHLEELPTRAKTRLKGNKEEALFSRKLATIKRDVPLEFELEAALVSDYDEGEVHALFEELQFRSLLSRLPKSSRSSGQGSLFGKKEVDENLKLDMPDNYQLVEGEKEQEELRELLSKQKVIAVDTENDRLGARQYPIVGISLATEINGEVKAWYVPVTPKTVKDWQELLEDEKVGKVGQNLKYDYQVLKQSGITLGPIVFDTMLASYLLKSGTRQHSLEVLALEELGHKTISITDLIGGGKDQKAMSEVPLDNLAVYAAEDAEISWKLYEVFMKKIKDDGLDRVMEELEVPLVEVLAEMELAGVKLDEKVLTELGKQIEGRIKELKKGIWKAAGREFNVNSTQQLRVVLFDDLKLSTEGIKRTQTGYSTAASELKKLRGKHPVIDMLEEYRELAKLESTYVTPLPVLIDKKTGRIHGSFNQTVAATGRLSSTDPNLQNIPARTDLGQQIRSAFVADRGNRLIKADYSQLELRIAAHMAKDDKMIETFRAGEDIHRATAAWVNGLEPDRVTDRQRRAAKTLNFGVLYGMGPGSFAQAAEMSMEEARLFIERYHEQYAGITEMIEKTIEQAEELGWVETLLGRRRYVPEINSRSPQVRAGAERAAFNFPIQGTAADILKKAMVELHEKLGEDFPGAKMVLTVHDELVVEVKKTQAEKLARDMKGIMERVFTLDVPLEVDVSIGANWRDMEGVES